MEFFQAILGNAISVAMACLFVAGVLKLFQIQTTLTEIKEALVRREVAVPAAIVSPAGSAVPPGTGLASGEDMLRALDRQLATEEFPLTNADAAESKALEPEVVNPPETRF